MSLYAYFQLHSYILLISRRSSFCCKYRIIIFSLLSKFRFIFLSLYHFSLNLSIRQTKKTLMKTNPSRSNSLNMRQYKLLNTFENRIDIFFISPITLVFSGIHYCFLPYFIIGRILFAYCFSQHFTQCLVLERH